MANAGPSKMSTAELDLDDAAEDLEKALRPVPPILEKSTLTKAKPPHGFRYWYDSMCDAMFENPSWNLNDVAKSLGRNPSWVYVVAKSDSFRAHYEQRRSELNERITFGITKKASELAMKSLDALLDKMDKNPEAFNIGTHLEVVNSSTKILGMGQPRGPQVVVNQQTNVVPAATQSELQRARELIRASEQSRLSQPKPEVTVEETTITLEDFDGDLLELEANAPAPITPSN